MTDKEFLGDRRQALEDAFFHKENERRVADIGLRGIHRLDLFLEGRFVFLKHLSQFLLRLARRLRWRGHPLWDRLRGEAPSPDFQGSRLGPRGDPGTS